MAKTNPTTKKVTAVFLENEIEGTSDKSKMFFCFNCRIPLIEYSGKVMTIIPGHHPYTPSTVLKCKGTVRRKNGEFENCGYYYSFMGSVYTKNPEID